MTDVPFHAWNGSKMWCDRSFCYDTNAFLCYIMQNKGRIADEYNSKAVMNMIRDNQWYYFLRKNQDQ